MDMDAVKNLATATLKVDARKPALIDRSEAAGNSGNNSGNNSYNNSSNNNSNNVAHDSFSDDSEKSDEGEDFYDEATGAQLTSL